MRRTAMRERSGAAGFDPTRLIQARRLAGLTRTDLAVSIGHSPAGICWYETGVNVPNPYVLRRIAAELDQPIAFFAPGRPAAHLDTSDFHFCVFGQDRT